MSELKKVKSYSLKERTIERVRELSETLNISESATLEVIIKIGFMNINDSIFKEVMR